MRCFVEFKCATTRGFEYRIFKRCVVILLQFMVVILLYVAQGQSLLGANI